MSVGLLALVNKRYMYASGQIGLLAAAPDNGFPVEFDVLKNHRVGFKCNFCAAFFGFALRFKWRDGLAPFERLGVDFTALIYFDSS